MDTSSIPRTSGVYVITCIANGKVYVGSGVSIRQRRNAHRSELQRNKHSNTRLQNAWNKYGANAFTFEVIELCGRGELIERENHWIIALNATDARYGFNICPQAESTMGRKCGIETRAKIGASNKGKRHSDEARARMSASRIDNKNTLGYKHTAETRLKMAQARRGRKHTAETIAKLGASQKKTYLIISPDGAEFYVTGLSQFCRQHNLDASTMSAVARGKHKTHKGWKCRGV